LAENAGNVLLTSKTWQLHKASEIRTKFINHMNEIEPKKNQVRHMV